MGKKKPAERKSRLGPCGPGVRVVFNDYAKGRFHERLASRGVTLEVLAEAIRLGNTKKRDERDPNGTDEAPRFRRWVQVRCGDTIERVRVVFFVRVPGTPADPGEVEVLNVMIVKAETGR